MYEPLLGLVRDWAVGRAQEEASTLLQGAVREYSDEHPEGSFEWSGRDITRPPTLAEREPWRHRSYHNAWERREIRKRSARDFDRYIDSNYHVEQRRIGGPANQHKPTRTEVNHGNPYRVRSYSGKRKRSTKRSAYGYGSRKRRRSTGGIRKRRVGLGRRRRVYSTRSRSSRGIKMYVRGSRRLHRRSKKGSRRLAKKPSRLRQLTGSRSASFEPVDRYRKVSTAMCSPHTTLLGFKSPLTVIAVNIGATALNQLCTFAAAEFLRRTAAGSDANLKFPTGLQVSGTQRLTFFPVCQTAAYVRLYIVTAKPYPGQDDRVFATDYASSWTADGVPNTFEKNDALTNNITAASAYQNYFVLPWVSIYENKELLKNWNIRKVKSFKIGPGHPPKTFSMKSRPMTFTYSDLDYAGYGTVANVPKGCKFLVCEIVGENVVMDTVTQSTPPADTGWFMGPGITQVGYRNEEDYAYRPFWGSAPEVNTTVNMTQNYKSMAPVDLSTYQYMWHPAARFGIGANSTHASGQYPNIIGYNSFGQDNKMDVNAFVSMPIRAAGMRITGAVGSNWDAGEYDTLSSAINNGAIHTEAS